MSHIEDKIESQVDSAISCFWKFFEEEFGEVYGLPEEVADLEESIRGLAKKVIAKNLDKSLDK